MGASLGGGGGRGRAGRYRPLAEINVTPLVDVMLVLLIIFMVTAPLLSSAVNVDLPKTAASPINQDSEPLTVSIDAQGQVYLQDQKVELAELVTKLRAIAQDQKDRRIFVRGDRTNSYGRVIEVMGTIVQGGFTKAALLSETPAGADLAAPPPAAAPGAPASGTPAGAPAPAAPARSSAAAPQGRG